VARSRPTGRADSATRCTGSDKAEAAGVKEHGDCSRSIRLFCASICIIMVVLFNSDENKALKKYILCLGLSGEDLIDV
jgi:hypothetical protein